MNADSASLDKKTQDNAFATKSVSRFDLTPLHLASIGGPAGNDGMQHLGPRR